MQIAPLFFALAFNTAILSAAETKYFTDAFDGPFSLEKWEVLDGRAGISTSSQGLEMNSAKVAPISLRTRQAYGTGIFHIRGIKVTAGRCWILGLADHNQLEGISLREDSADNTNLSVTVKSEEGEVMLNKELPALPPGSSLDVDFMVGPDKITIKLSIDGTIRLDETIPADDFPTSCRISMTCYANTVWSIKEISTLPYEPKGK